MALTFAALLSLPVPIANAAFPGENGRIAYERNDGAIWTVNADGSDQTQISSGTSARRDHGPAWSPDGTRIAFTRVKPACPPAPCHDIYVANADGSGAAVAIPNINGAESPTWSPTGDQIAFIDNGALWKANLDGTGRTLVYAGYEHDLCCAAPAWSPVGTTIAIEAGKVEPFCDPITVECYDDSRSWLFTAVVSPPNSFPSGPDTRGLAPNWSPDGESLVFHTEHYYPGYEVGEDGGRIGVVNADGSGRQLITPANTGIAPAWSPDGTRIVFQAGGYLRLMNAEGTGDALLGPGANPDWQPRPVNTPSTSSRARHASPFRVALVPAAAPCTTPNREHGPPLASGSCSPVQRSTYLTVGIGDGNPALARSVGFMRMKALAGAFGPPDDSDVTIRLALSNVMRADDRSEYTGELRGELTVRRTDRESGLIGSTSIDFPFGFTVPCAPTPESSLDGSSCITTTSVNALIPNAIKDTQRTIWALDKLRVYDGGPDGDADTEFGKGLFMTQGVFVP